MSTTRATPRERAVAAWRLDEPPAPGAVDRLALRVGLALILWGRRRSGAPDRAEQALRTTARSEAAAHRRRCFERRAGSGPAW